MSPDAAYAEGVLQEWWARGYVMANDLETRSTRLIRVEPVRDLGVLGMRRDGTVTVVRHDEGGR